MIELGSVAVAVLTIFAIAWGGWTAVFLHGKLNAIVEMRLVPTWTRDGNDIVRISIEIENIGEIRAGIDHVLLAVAATDHSADAPPGSCVGPEWVDFSNADRILTSTQWILPKETVHTERLYGASGSPVIHVGIQIHLNYPWYVELLGSRFRTRRQTRTFYVSKAFAER